MDIRALSVRVKLFLKSKYINMHVYAYIYILTYRYMRM